MGLIQLTLTPTLVGVVTTFSSIVLLLVVALVRRVRD